MQGRRRNREGAQTRCDPLKSAPPHTHTYTPLTGSWAQEGGGRELERSAAVRPPPPPPPASYNPGPTPPHSAPPCPRGLRLSHRQRAGRTVPPRGGTEGWGDEQGPTGREMPGGQQRTLETAAEEPGHDWLDACSSVPLSIQGGFSPGGSEAGRALLKSFLCVCALIT